MYEIVINYVTTDKNGNDKSVKETLILEHAESFGNAEEIGYEYGSGLTGVDVVAIKRSKLREIVNTRKSEEDKIFYATIVDRFYDADKDETTETQYVVALFAKDISEAYRIVNDYMKQGFEDMELTGLKCTRVVDVIK